MDDILTAMRLGTRARFLVKIRSYEISLRPLTVAETLQLASEVAQEVSQKPEHLRNALTEHVVFSLKTLALASTSDVDRNDPKITEFVLQRLTPDELAHLFKEYCAGVDRVNPSLEELSIDRLRELVAMAKKNHSAPIGWSFLELVSVCRYLTLES